MQRLRCVAAILLGIVGAFVDGFTASLLDPGTFIGFGIDSLTIATQKV